MRKIEIIAGKSDAISRLRAALVDAGYACHWHDSGETDEEDGGRAPELVLLEAGNSEALVQVRHGGPPVIVLVRPEAVAGINGHLEQVADFLLAPYDILELKLRIARILHKAGTPPEETIRRGDLVIDRVKCEVAVGGRVAMLTFREYELLKFLAEHPGRTFTRDALLNRVWGYDYLGGDRTVDVHIRRLRSKIEDINHTFVETVRNIGYRFCRDA
ncbi:MAG: response regulator transcription factor [Chloroflexota bacterium]